MTLIHDDELSDAYKSIEERGFAKSDFTFVEGKIDGPADGTIGPLTGTVIVEFNPTGVSREYSTGNQSQWPYLFQIDLSRGAFS